MQKIHHAATVLRVLEVLRKLEEESADPSILDQGGHRLVQFAAVVADHMHLADFVFETEAVKHRVNVDGRRPNTRHKKNDRQDH